MSDLRERALDAADAALALGATPSLHAARSALETIDPAALDADVQYARGRILFQLGLAAQARAAYERALAGDGAHGPTRYSLGLLLAADGRTDEAIRQWEQVPASARAHVDAMYNAGQAYYTVGRFDDALRSWRLVLQSHPGDIEALRKTVQALHALGRHEDADDAFARLTSACQLANAPDPAAGPQYMVVDQFRVRGATILVKQQVSALVEEPLVPLAFVVHGEHEAPLFAVQLVSAARSLLPIGDLAFTLGVLGRDGYRAVGPGWGTRPTFAALRQAARAVIESELGASDVGVA